MEKSVGGFVYVMRNDAIPGMIKVGRTANLKSRVSSLSNSSLPYPFELVFYMFFRDSINAEREIHLDLIEFRVRKEREFFSCDQSIAIRAIESLKRKENQLERKARKAQRKNHPKTLPTESPHIPRMLNANASTLVDVYGEADGESVFLGQLSYNVREQSSVFQWSTDAMERQQEWSPLFMPVSPKLWVSGAREMDLMGLPGLIHDALPDGWGMLLMNKAFGQATVPHYQNSPLLRLAFLADRCWGALAFSPSWGSEEDKRHRITLDELTQQTDEFLRDEPKAVPLALLSAGTVPHGARPKVMVAVSADLSQALVGQEKLPPGYRHVLIKFAGDGEDPTHPVLEFCYTEAARAAGIITAPAALLEAGGRTGLCVDRFDRVNGQKRHVHSMAGIMHTTHRIANSDWLHVADILGRLDGGQKDLEQAFRRAVFNAVFCVRDDHTKNIAFMRQGNTWGLSPAFDIAYCEGPGGYHTMTYAEHQGRDVKREDLLRLAGPFGVIEPEVDRLIDQMRGQRDLMLKEAQNLGVAKLILDSVKKRFKEIDRCLKGRRRPTTKSDWRKGPGQASP